MGFGVECESGGRCAWIIKVTTSGCQPGFIICDVSGAVATVVHFVKKVPITHLIFLFSNVAVQPMPEVVGCGEMLEQTCSRLFSPPVDMSIKLFGKWWRFGFRFNSEFIFQLLNFFKKSCMKLGFFFFQFFSRIPRGIYRNC